jgi:hypothetical protein
MVAKLSGLSCPRCGSDSRLIARTPRNGVFPEMLTFRCAESGEIFTAPEDPERKLPDLVRCYVDVASVAPSLASRASGIRHGFLTG